MSSSRRWIVAAVVLAVFYFADGIVFARLARGSFAQVRFWRLASWVTCAIAFVAHVGFERYRRRSAPTAAAFHASLAAALGAAALAAAAIVRTVASGGRPRLLGLAFVAWPVVTMIPAFLVAWILAIVMRPSPPEDRAMMPGPHR